MTDEQVARLRRIFEKQAAQGVDAPTLPEIMATMQQLMDEVPDLLRTPVYIDLCMEFAPKLMKHYAKREGN